MISSAAAQQRRALLCWCPRWLVPAGELGPRQRLGDAALEPGLTGQTCRITAGEQDCLTPVLPRDEVLAPLKLWEFGRCLSWDWDFNMVFVNA